MSGADEQIAIDVDDSAIDAIIAKLDEVLRKTAEVVGEITMLQVTAQIPGGREPHHYVEALKRIERFGLMNIGGVVSVLMLAYTLYRQLTA